MASFLEEGGAGVCENGKADANANSTTNKCREEENSYSFKHLVVFVRNMSGLRILEWCKKKTPVRVLGLLLPHKSLKSLKN